MDVKEYYEAYRESVLEELWDDLDREPTEQEVDEACNSNGFENYMQNLSETRYEQLSYH